MILNLHVSIVDLLLCHISVVACALEASRILVGAAFNTFRVGAQACGTGIKVCFAISVYIPVLLLRFVYRILSERIENMMQEISASWEEMRTIADVRRRNAHRKPWSMPRLDVTAIRMPQFALLSGWQLHTLSFIVIAFFLASPFVVFGSLDTLRGVRDRTVAYGKTGFNNFSAGSAAIASNDFGVAKEAFAQSIKDFADAQSSLRIAGDHVLVIARFIPVYGKKLKDAEDLLHIGSQLASAGIKSADVLATVSAPDAFAPDQIGKTLDYASQSVADIADALLIADSKLATIDPTSLPNEYRSDFSRAKDLSAQVFSAIGTMQKILDLSQYALGIGHDRRYLVVMQNNREIRATGGFMGSYALLDMKRGVVKNLEIPGGGTYDAQGQLRTVLAAPWPLRIINPRWELQDANWYPDFPASAKKIIWFYENAGGPTVDGVIALNASVAERVLAIIGPIEHPSSIKQITADNFIDITQEQTEITYDRKKNKPKEFLGSLIEMIKLKIESDPEHYSAKLLTLIIDSLLAKDIQVYFRDEQPQSILHSLQLDNKISDTKSDYLLIVDTNIGGGKTDGVVSADTSYLISADESGGLTASLTITRTHSGDPDDFFTGRKNIDYVRIYVPYGAELLSAAGFAPPPRTEFENPPINAVQDADLESSEAHVRLDEQSGTVIYDSFGKTVFSNWIQTSAGSTSRATITYRLPFRMPSFNRGARIPYSLLLDRQSGSSIESFTFDARFPQPGTVELKAPTSEYSERENLKYSIDPFLASVPIELLYSSL